jgi:hypothetical protein
MADTEDNLQPKLDPKSRSGPSPHPRRDADPEGMQPNPNPAGAAPKNPYISPDTDTRAAAEKLTMQAVSDFNAPADYPGTFNDTGIDITDAPRPLGHSGCSAPYGFAPGGARVGVVENPADLSNKNGYYDFKVRDYMITPNNISFRGARLHTMTRQRAFYNTESQYRRNASKRESDAEFDTGIFDAYSTGENRSRASWGSNDIKGHWLNDVFGLPDWNIPEVSSAFRAGSGGGKYIHVDPQDALDHILFEYSDDEDDGTYQQYAFIPLGLMNKVTSEGSGKIDGQPNYLHGTKAPRSFHGSIKGITSDWQDLGWQQQRSAVLGTTKDWFMHVTAIDWISWMYARKKLLIRDDWWHPWVTKRWNYPWDLDLDDEAGDTKYQEDDLALEEIEGMNKFIRYFRNSAGDLGTTFVGDNIDLYPKEWANKYFYHFGSPTATGGNPAQAGHTGPFPINMIRSAAAWDALNDGPGAREGDVVRSQQFIAGKTGKIFHKTQTNFNYVLVEYVYSDAFQEQSSPTGETRDGYKCVYEKCPLVKRGDKYYIQTKNLLWWKNICPWWFFSSAKPGDIFPGSYNLPQDNSFFSWVNIYAGDTMSCDSCELDKTEHKVSVEEAKEYYRKQAEIASYMGEIVADAHTKAFGGSIDFVKKLTTSISDASAGPAGYWATRSLSDESQSQVNSRNVQEGSHTQSIPPTVTTTSDETNLTMFGLNSALYRYFVSTFTSTKLGDNLYKNEFKLNTPNAFLDKKMILGYYWLQPEHREAHAYTEYDVTNVTQYENSVLDDQTIRKYSTMIHPQQVLISMRAPSGSDNYSSENPQTPTFTVDLSEKQTSFSIGHAWTEIYFELPDGLNPYEKTTYVISATDPFSVDYEVFYDDIILDQGVHENGSTLQLEIDLSWFNSGAECGVRIYSATPSGSILTANVSFEKKETNPIPHDSDEFYDIKYKISNPESDYIITGPLGDIESNEDLHIYESRRIMFDYTEVTTDNFEFTMVADHREIVVSTPTYTVPESPTTTEDITDIIPPNGLPTTPTHTETSGDIRVGRVNLSTRNDGKMEISSLDEGVMIVLFGSLAKYVNVDTLRYSTNPGGNISGTGKFTKYAPLQVDFVKWSGQHKNGAHTTYSFETPVPIDPTIPMPDFKSKNYVNVGREIPLYAGGNSQTNYTEHMPLDDNLDFSVYPPTPTVTQ